MVDYGKPLQIRKNRTLNPFASENSETAPPPETPLPEKVSGIFSKPAFTKKPAFWFPVKGTVGGNEGVRLSRKEKIFFLDAFGSLVNAGIPIVRSLQIIYFQSQNPRLQKISLFLKKEIEGGGNIAKTAAAVPNVFSAFDIAMFEMGEATGKIGQALEIVTEREEKSLELSRKVKQALIYPCAIAIIAIAMISVIMTYVIPKIEGIYREANANLPAITTAVIAMSRFLREYGIGLLIVAGLLSIAIPVALKNPAIRMKFDESVLRIPVFGNLMRKKILVSYCEFLSSLLMSGIVINRALAIVKNGLENRYYEAQIDAMLEDVKTGHPLSSSMGGEYTERKIRGEVMRTEEENAFKKKIECFPIELSTAVKVGEQTGTLARMLGKSAKRYGREIDALIKNLSSMLEPVVIVGVGGIVGTIVLAIMLPFFNMANVVR